MFYILDVFANAKQAATFGCSSIHDDMIKALSKHKNLTEHHKMVKTNPKIKAYLRKRAQYPF